MTVSKTGWLAAAIAAMALGASPAVADRDGLECRAKLKGANEVPTPIVTPTDGEWRGRVNADRSAIEFRLKVNEGERITQAHLHCAPEGVNGPIVVFLAGLHAAGLNVDGRWVDNATITGTGIVNTACGADIPTLVQAMLDRRVYVNVHSVQFGPGVVRGQVRCRDDGDDD
jgi:hypothetical protein